MSGNGLIGRSVRRAEDEPLITGSATFASDLILPNQLTAFVVRSPVAHGKLIDVDVGEARAFPGVAAAFTAADLLDEFGRIPIIQPRVSFSESVVPFLQPVLAHEKVRYVGEPVALVIAENRYVAEDAGDLVYADIDPIGVALELRSAVDEESLFTEGNEVTVLTASFGDPDRIFSRAPVVVEREFRTGRHSGVPMETRSMVVEYDDGSLTVHGSTKVPHSNRSQLSAHLGIPEERIRMLETSVGGSFGVRGEYYPEDFLIAWAATRLKRSIGWVEDRREHFISANQAREQVHKASIAGDEEGRILAIRSEFWCDMGGYVRTHGVRVPDLTLSMIPGPYLVEAYEGIGHCVVTNKTPTATYRAPGRFESCFVRERLIDGYAAAIGQDAVEVRRRNLILSKQMPYSRQLQSTGEPVVLNEGDYLKMLELVDAALDKEDLERRRAEGEKVGWGLAMFLEKSGLGPWETGSVAISSDGWIIVRSGGSSVGQGIRTALAQIAGEVFDVEMDQVRVEMLDSDITTTGVGSYASRSTATAGSAVFTAANVVLEKAIKVAADQLEVEPADLVVRDGRIAPAGAPDKGLSYAEIASSLDEPTRVRLNLDGELFAEERFHVTKLTYPYGCHAAVVAIDSETGDVRVERLILGYDVGRSVNPMLVEGQLHGGAIQGLAGALLERFVYDQDGNPLVTSFMDYLMPTATEAPMMSAIITEDAPTKTNPLGVKGAGEGGLTGVAAAIASAVDHALGKPGAISMVPIDPDVVRAAAAG